MPTNISKESKIFFPDSASSFFKNTIPAIALTPPPSSERTFLNFGFCWGFLKTLKKQNKAEEKLLEKSLKVILEGKKNLISIRIDDYNDLIAEIKKEIEAAKKKILIRLWSEEMIVLEKELRRAESKGVSIQLLSFTPLENPIGETFSYNIDPHSFTENGERGIALFIDEERVIVGNKIGKYPIHAMLTNDPLITESIKDQILLDVELVKNKREMRKE